MKLIPASAVLITEKDPYKKIELAGRTCYKSEDKITDESAPKFARGLIKSKHTAMVEHQVFVFEIASLTGNMGSMHSYVDQLRQTPYFHVTENNVPEVGYVRILVSANVRAISERGINDPVWRAVRDKYPDLAYGVEDDVHYLDVAADLRDIDEIPNLTEEELAEHKNLTFRFVTDRGVTHELVRHRPCSFAQESTRYVDYANQKYGEGLLFIEPADYDEWSDRQKAEHEAFLAYCESHYRSARSGDDALKPQQIRADLTTCIKTEIVVTANLLEWKHIFNLRLYGTTGAPHPDIKHLMALAEKQLENCVLEGIEDDARVCPTDKMAVGYLFYDKEE